MASTGASAVRNTYPAELHGLTRTGLAWLQATNRRGWAAALSLCLSAAVALTVTLPLIDAMAVESGLDDLLVHDGGIAVEQSVTDVDAFSTFERAADSQVTARLSDGVTQVAAYATAGPMSLATIDAAPAGRRPDLSAAYLDHLGSHVAAVAGQLPAEGLGGGDPAVSMSQATADRLGLRISDRFCLAFGGVTEPRWCARVVALWQPLDAREPFWGGAATNPARLQLTMGRYDFFQLAKLVPPQETAGLLYWANPAGVDARSAPAVAARAAALRADLSGRSYRVTTRFDGAVQRFDDEQRAVSATVHVFTAAVALLCLLVVALVGARFLGGQARERAVLRARGWPAGRLFWLAFGGPGTLALVALPVGLAACAIAITALSLTGSGLSALSLRGSDLAGAAPAVLGSLLGIGAALVPLAAAVAARDGDPSPDGPARASRAWWRRAEVALVFAILGLIALLLPRLLDAPRLPGGDLLDLPRSLVVLAPAAGLVLLAAVPVCLRPLGARIARGRQTRVALALAARQLERAPEQHATISLLLVLAAAICVFAAIGFAAGFAPEPLLAERAALRHGLQVALAAGAAGALVMAMIGFGLHFRAVTRQRTGEYLGLLAHGLAGAEVAASVRGEQLAAARSSLAAGAGLGLVLALVALPEAAIAATALPAVVGAAAVLGALVAGLAFAGSAVSRLPAHVNPLGFGG